MNINSRWWDVTLIAACLATVLIAVFDEKPGALSPLVPLGMGVIVVAHLTFGRRALREEDTPLVQVYTAVLVISFGFAMAGSGTAAISQTVIYPVLWAMSSTWARGVMRTVLLGVALVLGSGLGRGDWIEGSITALISVVFSIAVGTWIQRIADYVEERDVLLAQLRAAQADVAVLERAAGVEQERARVAREIHDTIAQSLTGLVMVVQRSQRELETAPTNTSSNLEVVGDLAQDALREARALVADFSQPAALTDSLHRVTTSFERETGTQVDLRVSTADLPREHEVAVLRTVQEALANVRKHAQASHVWITVGSRAPHGVESGTHEVGVWVEVADDGVGPTSASATNPGYGLGGLHDRLALVGGWVWSGPREPHGFLLRTYIPRSS